MADPHAQDATRAEIGRLKAQQDEIDANRQARAQLPDNAAWYGYEIDYANLLNSALALATRLLAAQPPGVGEPLAAALGELFEAVGIQSAICGLNERFNERSATELVRFAAKLARKARAVPASGGSTEPPNCPDCGTPRLEAGSWGASNLPTCPTCGAPRFCRPEPSAPAPCCPSCRAVREAAYRICATAVDMGNYYRVPPAPVEALDDATDTPCAGRAGAPRKEE